MASLLWTVLSALLLLHDSAAVTETELATITNNLYNIYKPTYKYPSGEHPTFTLAVSIPFNPATGSYDMSQVTTFDERQTVEDALKKCQVYQGQRVMAATVLKWPNVKDQCPDAVIPDTWKFVKDLCPKAKKWADVTQECTDKINEKFPDGKADHAEYRVLHKFNHFITRLNNKVLNGNKDLLVFYSYKSPCDSKCASSDSNWSIITPKSSAPLGNINKWSTHVLVFSVPFKPGYTSLTEDKLEENRRKALANLGKVIGGLEKIYLCRIGSNTCSRCDGSKGSVADACVSDKAPGK